MRSIDRVLGARLAHQVRIAAGLRPAREDFARRRRDRIGDGGAITAAELAHRIAGRDERLAAGAEQRVFEGEQALHGDALLPQRLDVDRRGIGAGNDLLHLPQAPAAGIGPEEQALVAVRLAGRAEAEHLDARPRRDQVPEALACRGQMRFVGLDAKRVDKPRLLRGALAEPLVGGQDHRVDCALDRRPEGDRRRR